MSFDHSNLPIAQLESLKFKATQIIESIQSLQRTIDSGPYSMPPWPDILSKYNILLSQSHNFSSALLHQPGSAGARSLNGASGNVYEKIALHPSVGMTDAQLDNEVIPLLRNQQTTDVLRMENECVKRLAEHMVTKGSLGVLGIPSPTLIQGRKVEYEDVLKECEQIKGDHDQRVDRAVRAVVMLRDKFEWKQRVEVEVEEPEELDWDPRLGMDVNEGAVSEHTTDAGEDADGDVGMDTPGQSSEDDHDEVAEGLVEVMDTMDGVEHTQTPS
jgi:hypothetical protein